MSRFSPQYGLCFSLSSLRGVDKPEVWGSSPILPWISSMWIRKVTSALGNLVAPCGKWVWWSYEGYGPDLMPGWKNRCCNCSHRRCPMGVQHTLPHVLDNLTPRRGKNGVFHSSPSQESRAQGDGKQELEPKESCMEKKKSAKQFIRHRGANI